MPHILSHSSVVFPINWGMYIFLYIYYILLTAHTVHRLTYVIRYSNTVVFPINWVYRLTSVIKIHPGYSGQMAPKCSIALCMFHKWEDPKLWHETLQPQQIGLSCKDNKLPPHLACKINLRNIWEERHRQLLNDQANEEPSRDRRLLELYRQSGDECGSKMRPERPNPNMEECIIFGPSSSNATSKKLDEEVNKFNNSKVFALQTLFSQLSEVAVPLAWNPTWAKTWRLRRDHISVCRISCTLAIALK